MQNYKLKVSMLWVVGGVARIEDGTRNFLATLCIVIPKTNVGKNTLRLVLIVHKRAVKPTKKLWITHFFSN